VCFQLWVPLARTVWVVSCKLRGNIITYAIRVIFNYADSLWIDLSCTAPLFYPIIWFRTSTLDMLDGCSSHVRRLFLLLLLLILRCTFDFFLSLPLLFSLTIHFLLLSLLFFLLVFFHLSGRFSPLIFLQNIIFSELLFRFLFLNRGQNFLLRQILKHLSHRINKNLFFYISISGCIVLCK